MDHGEIKTIGWWNGEGDSVEEQEQKRKRD